MLNDGVHRVGRDAGEIVLGDPNVSGNHLELRVSSEQITLTDNGSSNGTYDPNGARLSAPMAMKPNEPYRLGGCSLTLLTSDSPAAGAPGPSTAGGTQAMPQFHAPNVNYGAAPPAAQWAPPSPGNYAPGNYAPGNYAPGSYAGYPPGPVMMDPYGTPPEARTFGMLCHIGALAGYVVPFGHLIGPLVFWLLKKDQHPFVDQQGKESLNFQITVTIAYVVFGTLSIFLIGIPFLVATGIAALIFEIIAGVRANSGIAYRYPFTLRLLT